MASSSSFNVTGAAFPYPKILFSTPAFKCNAAAVNPNCIKTFLANDLVTFFIYTKPVYIDGIRSLPRNLPGWMILNICLFYNFTLAGKLFVSQTFKTCVLGSNSVWRKSVSSIPVIYIDNRKVTPLPFFYCLWISIRCLLPTKRLLTPWKLGSVKKSKYWFFGVTFDSVTFIPANGSFFIDLRNSQQKHKVFLSVTANVVALMHQK